MTLPLNARDQQLFADALRAMLTVDAADPGAWEIRVLQALKPLVRAERGGVFYAATAGLPAGASEDYDAGLMGDYQKYYRERDPGRQRLAVQPDPVFSRAMLFRNGLDPLVRSECYNDFLVPAGMGDSAGMALPDEGRGSPGILALHRSDFGSDDFALHAPALMRMLYPALVSGWQARRRLGEQMRDLTQLVDGLSEAAAVYDADGRLLHANAPLEELFRERTVGDDLRPALDHAAARHGCLLRAGAPEPSPGRGPRPTCAGYRIRATLLESLLSDPVTLVTAEPVAARLPSASALVQRCGLTARQAEVALLLAQRLSSREIAERLVISPHTALRHVEAVRAKLNVRDRRLVAQRLRDLAAG